MLTLHATQYPNLIEIYNEFQVNLGVPSVSYTQMRQRMDKSKITVMGIEDDNGKEMPDHVFLTKGQLQEMESALSKLSKDEINSVMYPENNNDIEIIKIFPALKPLGDWYNYHFFNWY